MSFGARILILGWILVGVLGVAMVAVLTARARVHWAGDRCRVGWGGIIARRRRPFLD